MYKKDILFMFCMNVLLLVFTTFNSIYGSIICIIIFTINLHKIFLINKIYLLALGPILFFWSTELLSGVIIESGAFMEETGRVGLSNGAFARLSFFYAAYSVGGMLLFGRSSAGSNDLRKSVGIPLERTFLYGVLALTAAAALFGAARGFPLLEGIDRFRYRTDANSDAFISFLSNRFLMFGGLGLLFSAGTKRRLSLAAALWLFVLSAMFGEKFTSLGLGAIIFLIPIAVKRVAAGEKLRLGPIIGYSVLASFIVIFLILLNYGLLKNAGVAVDRMMSRIAEQGQLWYLTDEQFGSLFNYDGTSISAALKSLIVVEEQSAAAAGYSHGMYYVMAPFLLIRTLIFIIDDNGGFVFAHMPYWLMVSGYFGVAIVGSLTFALYVFNLKRIILAVQNRDLVSLLIWIKLLTWVLSGYTMGDFWFFFGIKSIGVVGAGMIWDVVRYRKNSFEGGAALR